LGQALLFNFDRNPDGIAQVCNHNGHVLTYRELKTQTIRVAENLQKLGYTSGDMVTILARNGQTLAPVVFGSILRGMPINPLDATFDTGDIAHMFSITHPKLVFCDWDFVGKVEAALKTVGIVAELVTFEKPVAGYKFVEELFAEIEEDERLYR
jgi:4-coumarate--CoA ligase